MSRIKKVGMHVPYTWDEPTYLACSLADLARETGTSVSLLSSQSRDSGVDHRWDELVNSGKRQSFFAWRQDCSHLIWFDVQPNNVIDAHKEGIKNILIPLWHRLAKQELLNASPYYDSIICPNNGAADLLKDLNDDVRTIPWSMGSIPFDLPPPQNGKRFLLLMDSHTSRRIGMMIITALRILFDFDRDAHFTVLYTKNWSAPTLEALRDLISCHGNRITMLKKPSHLGRMEAYMQHDWVFVPSIRENTGLFALEALSRGRPVISFDIRPHNEFLTHGENACLIPCEVDYNWLGAPEVVMNSFDLTEQLRTLCEDTTMYKLVRGEMAKTSQIAESRKRHFRFRQLMTESWSD